MAVNVSINQDAIDQFCQRWKVTELALFGSVLREDFRPDSDIDILVEFAPLSRWTLLDFVQMRDELSKLLGRKVDLISRRALEKSHNLLRRQAILESAQIIYVA